MFCDITHLQLKAGNGGNGCISFRREKYIPKGGPDGGDGGHGANIIFVATDHVHSLLDHHTRKKYQAKNGTQGGGLKCNGANAEDLYLRVPTGTLIKDADTEEVLADLDEDGAFFVAVRGGRGGYGNEHFKTATRQTPWFAEKGEPGEERNVILELQMVADAGIIGLPSAGKSTLISAITSCRPKIGDYPFTTLIPNLGVAGIRGDSVVVADIPGLIEGASEGKGLGDEFLRHISRNSVLVHLIDVNDADIVQSYNIIQNELKAYGKGLIDKKQIIVFNKVDENDLELQKMLFDDFRKRAKVSKDTPMFCISALMRDNLEPFLDELLDFVKKERSLKMKVKKEKEEAPVVYTPLEEESPRYYEIEEIQETEEIPDLWADIEERAEDERNAKLQEEESLTPRVFRIHGARINQIAIMTDFQNPEAVQRIWDIFKKLRIWNDLENKFHAKKGDKICFARFDGFIPYREKMDI